MAQAKESESISFSDAISERYLAYALSTITARSLPDVRDGLKPVHRRLLWAMLQLQLNPDKGFKKCARVVGDVIGKYHPHGDVAVYDTLVRLAQQFAVRYPLVEGQGNFGSIDGDNAAAMRYTESRLTDAAMALLEGIRDDTVDFRPTYDGSEEEPVVMPAAFPNVLANGSEGIAVGMATSIPPHNIGELCDALLHLIKSPNAGPETLLSHIKGPDFPTGGLLVEDPAGMAKAYETGRGAFRIRARWNQEKLTHGLYQIVITEIPYQVQKSRLMEKLAELFRAKKLPLLSNIRDESAEDIRIVLEPKSRHVDPELLMASLFKVTELETRFNLNMNVLTSRGVPKVLSLKEVLQEFLAHRMQVLTRRSENRLSQIAHRLEVLDGLLVAYLNLDRVIEIIRTEDEPKQVLITEFALTDLQAESILNMRLRHLRKLEEMEIRKEHAGLSAEQAQLQALLADEGLRWKHIAGEVRDVKKRLGGGKIGDRRTNIAAIQEFGDISVEAFIEKEPITIVCSKMGWIKAVKGHQPDASETKYKDGDEAGFQLFAQTTDKLLVLASNGRFYTLPCDKLPRGKGYGEPIRLMIEMDTKDEIVAMLTHKLGAKLLLASRNGKGFMIDSDDVVASTKNGRQIVTGDSPAMLALPVAPEHDHLAVIGSNRKLLIFPLEQLPAMKRGQGVQLQRYRDAELEDAKTFRLEEGLSWSLGERTRTETDLTAWRGNRSDAGKLPPTGFPKSNKFSG